MVLRGAGTVIRYRVELRRGSLTPAALPVLEQRHKAASASGSVMVVAEYVGPTMARLLRERQIAFMDVAGNAYVGTQGLHIWVRGKQAGGTRIATGLHRRSAVKVIFALLADPLLDADPQRALLNSPVRALAGAADVALGSVGGVLASLKSLGYLLSDGERRVMIDRERLIELWSTDYLARLRHRLVCRRFRLPRAQEWSRLPELPSGVLWGGQVAGALLTRHLRPDTLTLYAGLLPDEWIVRAGLDPDDENGNVEVLRPFWGRDLAARWRQASGPACDTCVHPLLVYADLLAGGDERQAEAAKRVYDEYLHRIVSSD